MHGFHRWQEGWGHGAASHLTLRVIHRILIFTIEIVVCQLVPPSLIAIIALASYSYVAMSCDSYCVHLLYPVAHGLILVE